MRLHFAKSIFTSSCNQLAIIILSLLTSFCTGNTFKAQENATAKDLTRTETFTSEVRRIALAVDILFVLDTSKSMVEEQKALESNLRYFFDKFLETLNPNGYQVFFLGDSFNLPSLPGRVSVVSAKVGSHNGLEILDNFFEGKITSSLSLNPQANKHAIMITDDNAGVGRSNIGITAQQFLQKYNSYSSKIGKLHMHSIVGLPTDKPTPSCNIENVGTEFISLSQNPAVAGVFQSICNPDWSEILTNIGDSITQAEYKKQFEITGGIREIIEVMISGKPVDKTKYQYDSSTKILTFTSDVFPRDGQILEVKYSI